VTSADETSAVRPSWAATESPTPTAPASAAPPRRRLFRKYALLFIGLVGAALLINSGFDFWFSYQENQAALIRVQQEKAEAAAQRIEEFVDEIKSQIGWTTHAQWSAGPLDQRRQDYFRLLRQVPAITELTQLSNEGRECLTVSRLKMDVIHQECDGPDWSKNPGFIGAKAQRVWFSPVYFRKQSEPYLTLAMAREGRNAGVTIAEINLKLIYDVITALKIGQGGYAYVVDGHGKLLAHPDISLVLRDTDLAALPQVAAALASNTLSPAGGASRVRGPDADSPAVSVAQNIAGRAVLTAHAGIPQLGWLVFVEVPLREAFAPLYGAAWRTAILLALGLVAAALAALLLARRMTGPIRAIAEGAERLGGGDLSRRIDIHTGDELEGLAQQFNRMAADLQKSYAELEQRVRDRTAELSEALEQQTATSEVLGVINSSPGDLAPVFDSILEKAMDLCEAAFGQLAIREAGHFHTAATRGMPPAFVEYRRGNPPDFGPETLPGRLLAGERLLHVPDLKAEAAYQTGEPNRRALVDLGGVRTALMVPLSREDAVLGFISVYRQDVRPFGDKQIALLQNFAAQAVIAMENARLITETREALDQQTATAEVLGVINASPGDLAPVFDAILEKAHSLCGADFGGLLIFDGELLRPVAHHNMPARFTELISSGFRPGHNFYRLVSGAPFAHADNLQEIAAHSPDDSMVHAAVEIAGIRTQLMVPLRKDDRLLGVITANRGEIRPFSDKQIALLQNFAAQAVIAMENARLITETREALEQQTATAEVLGVINSSPGDLAPVFDAMLEKAMRLCGAAFGELQTYDGERFTEAAMRGLPARYAEFRTSKTHVYGAGTVPARLLAGERPVHVLDITLEDAYRDREPNRLALADLGGARTVLAVPLLKDDAVLGFIVVYRQEVRPFTDKQIALLQNFAAQAVIAMENARLITETREALEQQTATAEVLGVINASPGDLAPVFDALLDKATALCQASFGLLARFDGERYHAAALHGVPTAFAQSWKEARLPVPGMALYRLVQGEDVIHVEDVTTEDVYRSGNPYRRALGDLGGARTALWVALRKDRTLLGAFVIYRQEVRLFSAKQVELLRTFADQAVIAIDNARLLNELRDRTRDLQESLEYQTATSDVLKVISRSDAELEPVLENLVETATRLCQADYGHVFRRREDDRHHLIASFGLDPEYREFLVANPFSPDRGTLSGRVSLERRVVHIEDAGNDPEYTWAEAQQRGNLRTGLGVPLLRDETLLGIIVLYRSRVERFTEKQITLAATFADQAVIAIENARLLGALRERTDELAHSVEELKALAEVGQEVSSTLDLGAVLATILNRSVALSGADAGAIFRYSESQQVFRLAEAVGWNEALVNRVRELRIAEHETGMGEATRTRRPLQLADLSARPSYPLRDATLAAGFRSVLIVPLVGAERVFGAIVLERRAAGEFPEAAVRLMQTLASQSVLAIQNARLFREIADKSEELRLASQHKSQFLANMSHELRTPLNAILGYTELMVDGIYGGLPEKAAGVLERVQNNGKHLLALINDVLDLSKIEAGQLVLTLEEYALPDVVQSVVTATEGLASTKGLKMTAEVAPGLPTGRGDARRLSQVLLNLVGNAVKFTDQGEVAIRARAENGHFVLTVRDTGPGIAPEDHSKVFEEFQQVDSSNTRKKGGTGLGLAISKRMVEMQGGSISIESELGHGATFRVSLPIRVEEVVDELAGELMGAA
jgi:GAF domain-containing protein/two-component sensor histidine kinase